MLSVQRKSRHSLLALFRLKLQARYIRQRVENPTNPTYSPLAHGQHSAPKASNFAILHVPFWNLREGHLKVLGAYHAGFRKLAWQIPAGEA